MPTIHPALPADGDDAIVEPYNAAINLILSVLNGSIDIDNLADGAVGLSKLSAAVQGSLTPTGAILPFGGTAAPTGFLLCDGSSYLRGSYSALFAVLGSAYGSADGTHFNVPDLRGRTPVGLETMGGSSSNRLERTSTITTTNASNSATVGSATGLSLGMYIKSTNVPAGTTITGISGTTITMSANASASGTTIAARFSMVTDAEALGGAGGEDVHTLVGAEMPDLSLEIQAAGGGAATRVDLVGTGNTGWTPNLVRFLGGGNHIHNNTQPSLVVAYIIKI